MINDVLTNLSITQFRRAASYSVGLALLWVVLGFIRSGTTFHLAPALVAAVFPVVFAYDTDEASTRDLGLAFLAGLAIALVGTLILAVAGQMTGPSLLPIGGAVTESVVFAIAGAAAGFIIATIWQRNRL